MTCTIQGCVSKLYATGLCRHHFNKRHYWGDPEHVRAPLKKTEPCRIEGCDKLKFANDLCPKHNRRLQRHGDPLFENPKCRRDGGYKTRHRQYLKGWKRANRKTVNAYIAARKKRCRTATPPWADIAEIQRLYAACPAGHHVDHIVPLNGENVSGLHVSWNLQYLPAAENLKKSNKF